MNNFEINNSCVSPRMGDLKYIMGNILSPKTDFHQTKSLPHLCQFVLRLAQFLHLRAQFASDRRVFMHGADPLAQPRGRRTHSVESLRSKVLLGTYLPETVVSRARDVVLVIVGELLEEVVSDHQLLSRLPTADERMCGNRYVVIHCN